MIISCLTPRVCVCFPMFVYILIYWPSEGLVELWQPLWTTVCAWHVDVWPMHMFVLRPRLSYGVYQKPCGMAWEAFNNGYSIAKLFIDGDLGNSSVEACSTGVYIIYFNLNWWFLCSTWRLRIIPPWCLFVCFPGYWKELVMLSFLSLGPLSH